MTIFDQLRAGITAGFRGKLDTGRLLRPIVHSVDANNDPSGPAFTVFPFEGFVDDYSVRYKEQASIPMTDVKLIVIAETLGAKPRASDIVQMTSGVHSGSFYQIRNRTEDPAGATYECQSFETKSPL